MLGGINELIVLGYEFPTTTEVDLQPLFGPTTPAPMTPVPAPNPNSGTPTTPGPVALTAAGFAKLVGQFQQKVGQKLSALRTAERIAKAGLEKAKNQEMQRLHSEAERRTYLQDTYVPGLRQVGLYYLKIAAGVKEVMDSLNAYMKTCPNNTNGLYRLAWSGSPAHPETVVAACGLPQPTATHDVLHLLSGANAYVQANNGPTGGRAVFRRRIDTRLVSQSGIHSKDYVQDDRGIFTRRLAYGAKSIQNCVRLLLGTTIRGRYVEDGHAVDGVDPYLESRFPSLSGQQQLTQDEVLFVNQELGSGPQQRGICLSSTSKLLHGNKGETFLNEDSYLIEVDLARVGAGAGLYNLYSEEAQNVTIGIANTHPDTGVVFTTAGAKSHTDWSTAKNRELFLKELRLAYVTNTDSLIKQLQTRLYYKKDGVDVKLVKLFQKQYPRKF